MSVEASERLMANADKIMHRFEKRAKSEIQAAISQESLVLQNSLKDQLYHLAEALLNNKGKSATRQRWELKETTRLGKLHGTDRASRRAYTLDQLISEFHILRQVTYEVMEEEKPLTSTDREIITSAIEQAVNDAASEFTATHTNIQQEIVHTLAHDLRGPVTAAKLIAQQLQRKCSYDENLNSMTKQILKNMDRLDLMIKDLLDAGSLSAGKRLPLEFKESDLNSIVIKTVKDLNFIYSNRFKYVSTGECLGSWSEKDLQRMIENLATNAIKYGAPNSLITITLDNSGFDILLKVHNVGSVIAIEDQKNLFQQYQRANISEEKTGWGLGLSIVQAIAMAHNGTIELESVEGKGTTFTIRFPKSETFNSQLHQNDPTASL